MKNKKILGICLRLMIIILGIVVIIFYIGPLVTTGEKNLGVITGLGFAGLLFLYAIFFNKINNAIKGFCKNKIGKIITSVICVVLAIGIGVSGYAFGNIVSHGKTVKLETEYIIVLGCVLRGDQPGVFLTQRLNTAYDYLSANPNSKAVLSGGQGSNEKISEAQCMFNYLVEKGIEPSRLIIEDKSKSTKENFENTAKLLESKGIKADELLVVTNEFHEYRASEFAKRSGFKAYSYPCKTSWNGYMPFATREIFAIVYQIYLN